MVMTGHRRDERFPCLVFWMVGKRLSKFEVQNTRVEPSARI